MSKIFKINKVTKNCSENDINYHLKFEMLFKEYQHFKIKERRRLVAIVKKSRQHANRNAKRNLNQIASKKFEELLFEIKSAHQKQLSEIKLIAIEKLNKCYELELSELNIRAKLLTKAFNKNITTQITNSAQLIEVHSSHYEALRSNLQKIKSPLIEILRINNEIAEDTFTIKLLLGNLEYNLQDNLKLLLS